VTGADGVRPEPLADRGEQLHLQPAAVHRQLRPAVSGVQAARLAPDLLAVPVVVGERAGRRPEPGDPLTETEFGQLTDGVRQQVEADAERAQSVRPLVHGHLGEARRVQAQRGGEATDAGARDDDHHGGTVL
jgi:hypothetical protein